jgi:hypothetical protein
MKMKTNEDRLRHKALEQTIKVLQDVLRITTDSLTYSHIDKAIVELHHALHVDGFVSKPRVDDSTYRVAGIVKLS